MTLTGIAGSLPGKSALVDFVQYRRCDLSSKTDQWREAGAVVLPHEEELAAVPKNGGTDARLFEPGVLLNDGNVPAILSCSFSSLEISLRTGSGSTFTVIV